MESLENRDCALDLNIDLDTLYESPYMEKQIV